MVSCSGSFAFCFKLRRTNKSTTLLVWHMTFWYDISNNNQLTIFDLIASHPSVLIKNDRYSKCIQVLEFNIFLYNRYLWHLVFFKLDLITAVPFSIFAMREWNVVLYICTYMYIYIYIYADASSYLIYIASNTFGIEPQGPALMGIFSVKIHVSNKPGTCAASQSEAMLENPC